jgi:hypothetical protein
MGFQPAPGEGRLGLITAVLFVTQNENPAIEYISPIIPSLSVNCKSKRDMIGKLVTRTALK